MTILYIIISLALFLFSYTQVDLNLTLSQVSIFQTIQKSFQYIGFYQRPLATTIFAGIVMLSLAAYCVAWHRIRQGKLTEKQFWKIVGITTAILVFSYPAAFSYDFFNYMFTAKSVLIYHKNPYLVLPEQFAPVDPWLNFMRWTHLPSAYSPLWIGLTIPAYLTGFGYFLTIMWSMKALVAFFHVATIVGIGKILEKVEPKHKVLGMAIFALNPLILIEDLVSSHNDVVMMAAAVWAIYFMLERKHMAAWFTWAVSVAAKTMTLTIAPALWLIGKNKYWREWALGLMALATLAVVSQREFLPWYGVWILPFVALLPSNRKITILATGLSMGLLLRYAPFLYKGDYNAPVPMQRVILLWIPIVISVLWALWTKKNLRNTSAKQ
jgi:hypothetical protein